MPTSQTKVLAAALAASVVASGCITSSNFLQPDGPRYAGSGADTPPERELAGEVQIGSFNVKYGEEVEGALELIRTDPGLRDSDILLLQEMDSDGSARIAEALGMHWVYYPASLREGREFGNAVLSRWPILEDEKLLLPHEAVFGDTRRIATVATIEVAEVPVRVYSVHLTTPVNLSGERREEQWRTVLADASDHEHVIIGGDLNSHSLPEIAEDDGYLWATRDGPRTTWWGRVDHIIYKGLVPTWSETNGTVTDEVAEVSDHRPVWTRARIRADEIRGALSRQSREAPRGVRRQRP